jgi:hypothetical protein
MLSPADRIVEATMPHTLRPKGNDREKVIAATLEFLIEEFGYTDYENVEVIDVKDIRNLIDKLQEMIVEPPELNPKLIELGEKWMLENDEALRKLADT